MGIYAYRMQLNTIKSNVGDIGVYEFAFKVSTGYDGEAFNQKCYSRLVARRVNAWATRQCIPNMVVFAGHVSRWGVVSVYASQGVYYEDSTDLVQVGSLQKVGKTYVFTKID